MPDFSTRNQKCCNVEMETKQTPQHPFHELLCLSHVSHLWNWHVHSSPICVHTVSIQERIWHDLPYVQIAFLLRYVLFIYMLQMQNSITWCVSASCGAICNSHIRSSEGSRVLEASWAAASIWLYTCYSQSPGKTVQISQILCNIASFSTLILHALFTLSSQC